MCDTLVSITDDGVLFAKNSDRDPNEAQTLVWRSATDHEPGSTVDCTWITIPQVEHTHAVLLSQPWWMWGAEIGANEHGVVIGNEAVFTRELIGRRRPDALLGMDLLRLGLERARTATEAVGVIVEQLEAHGQGGSCSHEHPKFRYDNSFLVADPNGAIVLETADRSWATEEVTGRSRAISNGLTIPAFAKAHADPVRSRVTACAVRRGRTEPGAAAATGPADLFEVLRDHGTGAGPRWSRVHGGLTAPCVHAGGTVASSQSTASWVADLRGPVQHWATATSGPCTSLFKPVAVDEPVDLGPAPTNRFDDAATWWRHEGLHRLSLRDHPASLARYRAERDRTEATWLAEPPTSAHAFAVVRTLEDAWEDDLWRADLPDRRPPLGPRPVVALRRGGRSMTDPVIVVGAGLAGLAAARRLVASGLEVVVLEARDRVGGRTEGGHTADGTPVELGGQWVGPGQTRMYELIEELGLVTFPTWNEGQLVIRLGGKQTRMGSQRGAVPKLNPFALADLAQGLARFTKLSSGISLEEPWRSPGAADLDGQTFETWIRRNLRTPAGRSYFRIACEAVFSAESTDLSALHAAFYAHSGSDLETLLSVEGGAQQDRIVGGSILIAETMAAELGDRVRLGAPVRTIEHDEREVRVVLRDGEVVRGSQVIVTLPPTLAGRLDHDPPLPSWRDQLTQRLPAGSVIKLYAIYPEPFWRADGLNGQAASDEGPVKVTFDNSPPSGTPGVLMGFMEANDGRRWARRSVAERRAAAIECFVRSFGPKAAEPIEYLERDWMAEEFSRGCYGAHFTPGVWTAFGDALREPVGRIRWAGAECSPVWNGYMEGAVRSGETTADDVAAIEA